MKENHKMQVTPLPHVASIPPYPPGRPIEAVAREFHLDPNDIIKLASNENPRGCSSYAVSAMRAQAEEMNLYPDFDCFALYEALSKHIGVSTDELVLGAGSSELIAIAVRALMGKQHNAIIPQYSFQSYEGSVRSVGGTSVIVDTKDWQPDLDAMLAAVDENTRVVFLTSPNNPTGILIPKDEILRFARALPKHVLLILDCAYTEYVDQDMVPAVQELLSIDRDILILRTFSKVYGLAGLRVGYGIANPELVSILRRMILPFSVNAQAQAAATAALADQDFVNKSVAMNAFERQKLSQTFGELGLEYVPSYGNFILVKTGDGPALFQAMMRRGMIVRPVANYGLREWLRITVGLPEENEVFLRLLREMVGK